MPLIISSAQPAEQQYDHMKIILQSSEIESMLRQRLNLPPPAKFRWDWLEKSISIDFDYDYPLTESTDAPAPTQI